MNTIFHHSLAWSGNPGATVLVVPMPAARANDARLYRRTLGPAPAYVSRALTVDSECSSIDQRARLGISKLAICLGALLGAAVIGWTAFAVWQFYLAVTHLTIFAQSAGA